MKISVDEHRDIVLKEVYNDLILETEEGNRLYVCMRDNTFELYVEPVSTVGVRYRIDMEKRSFIKP